MMLFKAESHDLRGNILAFATPAKISEIATRIGFDSRASFTLNVNITIFSIRSRRSR